MSDNELSFNVFTLKNNRNVYSTNPLSHHDPFQPNVLLFQCLCLLQSTVKHDNKLGHWLEVDYVPSIIYNIPKQPFQVFYRVCVLRNFAKFWGRHRSWSPFYSNVADLSALFLRKYFMTSVLLLMLQNFLNRVFYRTPPDVKLRCIMGCPGLKNSYLEKGLFKS